MRAVSLFSGCLGLDLGLERLGIDAACYVENDKDCLRLIRARRPDVRIVEDVLLVDAKLEDDLGPVDLVAGGFPCQDLSYAGRGAGLDGSRSGLWFEMARIVRDLSPALVLVENVPGLLTRGLGVVTHELAAAGYVGRWFTLGAVDVGAPHRRERVFVTARKVEAGVDPSVFDGPHPSGLFDAAGWLPPQESLFDVEPLPRLGKRGRWTLDSIWEEDARQAIDDDSDETLLPTPNAYESTPTDEFVEEVRAAGVQPDERLYLPGRKWHAQRTLSRIAPLVADVGRPPLLPTPSANDANGGEGATREARQENGTGGPSLRDLPHLLPTPAARDGKGPNPNEREGGLDLPGAVDEVKLLPTPTAGDSKAGGSRNLEGSKAHASESLTDVVQTGNSTTPRRLLPTPVANPDNPGAGGELRAAITHGPDRRNETGIDTLGRPNVGRPSRLLPTPQAADGEGGRQEKGAMGNGGRRPSGQKANLPLPTAVALREELTETPFTEEADQDELLPTPTAGDGDRSSEQFSRHYSEGADNPTLLGSARRSETSWGVYEPAIRRWEETLGRAAPAPTDEKGRLSPWFVEWMMGEPDGWTDLDGISRTARLRMLGNAVQSQVGYRVGLRLFALDLELAGERTEEVLQNDV